MNANLFKTNWTHFITAANEYWAWFIDEHENCLESNNNSFEENSYASYVINTEDTELQ